MELSINYIADKVCEYFLGKNADLKRNEEEALIQFEDVNYTASKVFGAIISASVFDSLADLVKIIYEEAEKVAPPDWTGLRFLVHIKPSGLKPLGSVIFYT